MSKNVNNQVFYVSAIISEKGFENINQVLDKIYERGLEIVFYQMDFVTKEEIARLSELNKELNLEEATSLKLFIKDKEGNAVDKIKDVVNSLGDMGKFIYYPDTICANYEETQIIFGKKIFDLIIATSYYDVNETLFRLGGMTNKTKEKFIDGAVKETIEKECNSYLKEKK